METTQSSCFGPHELSQQCLLTSSSPGTEVLAATLQIVSDSTFFFFLINFHLLVRQRVRGLAHVNFFLWRLRITLNIG